MNKNLIIQNNNFIKESELEARINDAIKKTENFYIACQKDLYKDIYNERIKNSGKKGMTFEEIGNCYNCSRQNIEQAQKIILKNLKKYFNRFFNTKEILDQYQIRILNINQIPTNSLELLQIYCNSEMYIDKDNGLIAENKDILETLEKNILRIINQNEIYSENSISIIVLEKFKEEYTNYPEEDFNNIITIIQKNITKKYFISLSPTEPNKYIIDLKNASKNNKRKLEYFFKTLYPNGVHLPQKKIELFESNIKELRLAMPEETTVSRRLYQKIVSLQNIIASNFGEFIHIDNYKIEHNIIYDTIERCRYLFSLNYNCFSTKDLFNIFQNEYIYKGITNHIALHSLLKRENSKEISLPTGNTQNIINPNAINVKMANINIDIFKNSKYYQNNSNYQCAKSNFCIICDESDGRKKNHKNIDYSLKTTPATATEREQIVKLRVVQGIFRENLLKKYKKCTICGIKQEQLLIASHIKPWKDSDDYEKQDPENGFLLCAWHDALFDKGFISFAHNGKIIISDRIKDDNIKLFGLNENIKISLSTENKQYLNFHRKMHCFENL